MNVRAWIRHIGFVMTLASGTASAMVVYSPITSFQDDGLEWIIDSTGNLKTGGTLDVGDRLVAVMEYSQTFGIPSGGPTNIAPAELTGIYDVTVVSKVASGVPNEFVYTLDASGAGGLLGGHPAGAMMALWLDGTPDLEVVNGGCGTLVSCLAAATDGSLWAVAGITGTDLDAVWYRISLDTIGAINNSSGTSSVGEFNFALEILVNDTGLNLTELTCSVISCNQPGGDGQIGLIGSASILGGAGLDATGSNAVARSDSDFEIGVAPEPNALLLLGIAFVGAVAVRRYAGGNQERVVASDFKVPLASCP